MFYLVVITKDRTAIIGRKKKKTGMFLFFELSTTRIEFKQTKIR